MCYLLCAWQVEERRRPTCSPGSLIVDAQEPRSAAAARVVRRFYPVGVPSHYPVAGWLMNILLGLLGHR